MNAGKKMTIDGVMMTIEMMMMRRDSCKRITYAKRQEKRERRNVRIEGSGPRITNHDHCPPEAMRLQGHHHRGKQQADRSPSVMGNPKKVPSGANSGSRISQACGSMRKAAFILDRGNEEDMAE